MTNIVIRDSFIQQQGIYGLEQFKQMNKVEIEEGIIKMEEHKLCDGGVLHISKNWNGDVIRIDIIKAKIMLSK